MLRSIRPSLICRALILVALILASHNIREQAAASDYSVTLHIDKAPAERESLRYGDRDFDQWRQILRTELKPEVRIEGLKALSAFGVNGYADEATAAICELMRGYDFLTEHADNCKVVYASLDAIKKIGGESLPRLKPALKSDKLSVRRFAAKAILKLDDEAQTAAALAVIAALGDKDWYVNNRCLDILKNIKKTGEIRKAVQAAAKRIIPALIPVVKEDDGRDSERRERRVQAILLIGMCGPSAKDAVPALMEAFTSPPFTDARLDGEIVYALGEIGPAAKAALPVLKSRYAEYLAEAKPPQKESKPGLFVLSKKPVIVESRPSSLVGWHTSTQTVAPEARPMPQTVKEAVKKIEGK